MMTSTATTLIKEWSPSSASCWAVANYDSSTSRVQLPLEMKKRRRSKNIYTPKRRESLDVGCSTTFIKIIQKDNELSPTKHRLAESNLSYPEQTVLIPVYYFSSCRETRTEGVTNTKHIVTNFDVSLCSNDRSSTINKMAAPDNFYPNEFQTAYV